VFVQTGGVCVSFGVEADFQATLRRADLVRHTLEISRESDCFDLRPLQLHLASWFFGRDARKRCCVHDLWSRLATSFSSRGVMSSSFSAVGGSR